MAILVCVPTNSECGFLSLHFLSNIYYQICWWQPFWRGWGGLQNNFDAFLWWLGILNTWKHSYWPLLSSTVTDRLYLSLPPSLPLSLHPLSFIKKCLFGSFTSLLTGSFIPPELSEVLPVDFFPLWAIRLLCHCFLCHWETLFPSIPIYWYFGVLVFHLTSSCLPK